MWGKLSILAVLVLLSPFAEAKHKCDKKCDCSEDFAVVKCHNMEKFPVFDFASKVKTLWVINVLSTEKIARKGGKPKSWKMC